MAQVILDLKYGTRYFMGEGKECLWNRLWHADQLS